MQGGVHIGFLDGDQGLAHIVQSREVRGCLNRVDGEGDVDLERLGKYNTLMLAAPSGRMTFKVKFSATMVSKS